MAGRLPARLVVLLGLMILVLLGLVLAHVGQDASTGPDDAVAVEQETADAVGEYPGRPPAGTLLWGAAVDGNGDPYERHERDAGAALGVHRTFFQWRHRTGYLPRLAGDSIAAGRLPWVSVKTPGWDLMASGAVDDEIDELLRAIDDLQGPVWLTLHHEPEGGGGINEPDDPGGPAAHVAMNRRVRQRMDALETDNIALVNTLMLWTWDPRSGRDPEDWHAPGVYDVVAVDHYSNDESSLLTDTWFAYRRWAADRGVDAAVGEWGMRGTDSAAGARVRQWYDQAAGSHADGRGARVVALAAFDSALNAPSGSWELQGEQLTAFRQLLRDPRSHRLTTSE